MTRYGRVEHDTGYGPPRTGSRTGEDDIEPLLELAASEDPVARRVAIKNLCTYPVQADDDRAWSALLDAFEDDDIGVRREALHALTDSTPEQRTVGVVRALEGRYGDVDPSLRRRIRKTLLHYRKTGRLTDAPR